MGRIGQQVRSVPQRRVIGVSALLWSLPVNLATTTLAVFVGRQGTAFEVSLVTMSHFLALFLFAPVWGAIADETGKHREILAVTGILASLSLFALGLTDGVWSPILLRGVYAVFFASFPPLMLTIVSESGGIAGRGQALGRFNSWQSIGFAAGQVFAGLSLVVLTYFEIYFVLGVVTLAATGSTLFVSNPISDRKERVRVSRLWDRVRKRLYPAQGDRSHLTTDGLHWVYVAVFLQSITFFGLLSLLPVYLTDVVGISETLMGVFLGVNPLSRTVLMVAFGIAVGKFGKRSVMGFGMVGTGLFAVIVAGATLPDSLLVRQGVVAIGFLVIAVSFSAVIIGSQTFIGDVASIGRESELMGFHSTALGVGGVVGPIFLGSLVTLLSYTTAFVILSTFSFAGTAFIVRGVEETRSSIGVQSDL